MRIFIALDIDREIRERIARFAEGVQNFAPDAKWVGPETFHITLKFIGEKSPEEVERVRQVLRAVKDNPLAVSFSGTGFFPNPRSARVFWVGIHADKALQQLAERVDEATASLGISREEHGFKPHLTLARARGASGSPRQRTRDPGSQPSFTRLQEKLQGLSEPDFGTMTATEFFLYESKLSPKGAQYTKLERYALQGGAGEPAKGE
jgi:RNA 2',3'-cyclic 3'-phosphodiesterase